MNNTSISSLWGYFLFVCSGLLLGCSPGCHGLCALCAERYIHTRAVSLASLWGTSKTLITRFSISFRANQSVKSLSWSNISIIRLGQECLWRLGWHITCNLQSLNWYISYISVLPGGENAPKLSCIAPFTTTPQRGKSKPQNHTRVTVPKVTERNEKPLCTLTLHPYKQATAPLKSGPALKKSEFV